MPRKTKTAEQLEAEAKAAEARLRKDEANAKRAALRARRKAMKEAQAALASYRAADKSRVNRDWRPSNVSADLAIISDAYTLNARSRQMVRDNDYAASIVRAFTRNVVGKGITPAFRSPDDAFNEQIKEVWKRWSRSPKLVDRERRRNFRQMQEWAIREVVTVGECLLLLSYEPRRSHPGVVLQCVEAEQLDTTKLMHNGNEVRGGVEVDEHGAAVAYWIYTHHPNDLATGQTGQWHHPHIRQSGTWDTRESHEKGGRKPHLFESIRIPAFENGRPRVIHLYDPERCRQTRGVTRLASTLQRLRDLDQYDMAQLIAARAEACIGLVIKSEQVGSEGFGLNNSDTDDTDTDGNDELSMQPLMVARLREGEDVTGFEPKRPGNLYEPYTVRQLRASAAGVGISYEHIARDWSTSNYSGLRQGGLEDRREFQLLQELLITHLCQATAEEVVYWSLVQGLAATSEQDREALNEIDWRGDGWEWVDPEKQAKGIREMLDMGLTTLEIEANSLGRDWKQLQEQRQRESSGQATPIPEPGKAEPGVEGETESQRQLRIAE